jgi:hypothetical protein
MISGGSIPGTVCARCGHYCSASFVDQTAIANRLAPLRCPYTKLWHRSPEIEFPLRRIGSNK